MWTFFCLVLVFFLSFLVLQSSSSGREGCFTLIVVLLPCSCLLLAVLWVGLKYVGMTFLCHTHLLVNAMEFGYLFQRQAAKAPTSPWKYTLHAQIQRGGGGLWVQNPLPRALKNHKAVWFLSNTCPDPMKNHHKATKRAFHVGPPSTRQRNAYWRFAGRPMMARFYWYLDPLVPNQLKI